MTKILIVEDDTYLLKLYSEIFQNENFEVALAEDGREALQKAGEFVPEVILLDLMIPYIDGFGVLQELKKDPKTEKAKVVVLTNLDSETQKQKALSLGADKFLVKSGNTPDLLLNSVKETLAAK